MTMAKGTAYFTVADGQPSAVTYDDGRLPDGNYVIGWGMSEQEETLLIMFSPGDGASTLKALATTYFPLPPAPTDRAAPTPAEISRVMGHIGSISAPAKAASSRRNGRKGGRPPG